MFMSLDTNATARPGRSAQLNLPLQELMERLSSSPNGLTTEEAEERLAQHGRNELVHKRTRSPIMSFLRLLISPLSLILIAAGVVSAFFGETPGAIMIALMVLTSAILEFVQEYSSEKTAQKLAQQVAVTSTVLRDGKLVEIPMAELVPGDIIQLGVGDIVPADARVLTARDFFLDQAALTGESAPVEKAPFAFARKPGALPDMDHVVFFGTNVVSGNSQALVVETNGRTEFGRIAKSLAAERPPTEFQRGISSFTKMLIRVIGFLVAFIFVTSMAKQRGLLDSLLFAVAVSVGITPELLPMIITINLSAGARAMARNKVIVKHLQSIQNLGSMDILCTDKTGTLTEGRLALHSHVCAEGRDCHRTLELAAVNASFQASMKNPMDQAIAAHSASGECAVDLGIYTKVDEIPFDFTRRRMSVIVAKDGGRLLITKGAPEGVLSACTSIELRGIAQEMTGELRTLAMDEFAKLSADGYRALAVAYRTIGNGRDVYSVHDETGLTFVGYVSFIDPPKESAPAALKQAEDLGVEIKILTGDNELVTARICERVGLSVKGVLMGHEVDAMDDEELTRRAKEATIGARLSPDQKNRIITLLKKAGHVVGYMGDGINDAPSLRTADVGISVNNAVDVAKEAADIILLEEGLHILETGIIEGRKTFANTMKYIMMGTSSNFGNMFSVPAALFMVPFLPMLPVQILLNNLLYDFAQVTIPTDRVDEDYIAKPRRWDIGFIKKFMLVFGPISSMYDITTYLVMLHVFHADASLFHTGWFLESLATQTLVIHMIRSRHSLRTSRASLALTLSTIAVVCIGFAIPYTPLGRFFGFTPLPRAFFAVLTAMIAAYLLMVGAVKKWFYRRYEW
ncbi:MAG: magnesium-translocating P-type ATPase [Clostridia bacterium]|nr:magnesium-translocating P-type ATPase [Clostridia bacterium]